MFSSGSFRSISLATVTPSFVIVGDPNFLSSTTWRPWGPSVTFTASASWLTPRRIACRAWSPYTICFAMTFVSCTAQRPTPLLLRLLRRRLCLLILVFDDGQHVILFH